MKRISIYECENKYENGLHIQILRSLLFLDYFLLNTKKRMCYLYLKSQILKEVDTIEILQSLAKYVYLIFNKFDHIFDYSLIFIQNNAIDLKSREIHIQLTKVFTNPIKVFKLEKNWHSFLMFLPPL